MADSSARPSSPEASVAWERFYHLLSRGYSYIAQHPDVEAEILGLFGRLDAISIEGTELGRAYQTFPTIFIDFLGAYRHNRETVTLFRMMEARRQDDSEQLEWAGLLAENQKKAMQSANDQVSFLVREREKLVDRLAMLQTYFEYDSSDILMKLKGDWLQDRIDCLTVDIGFERTLARGLESAVEHYEAEVARLKATCRRLFFRLAEGESERAGCVHTINCLESQLSSFVMLIRAQFGFTFPPQ